MLRRLRPLLPKSFSRPTATDSTTAASNPVTPSAASSASSASAPRISALRSLFLLCFKCPDPATCRGVECECDGGAYYDLVDDGGQNMDEAALARHKHMHAGARDPPPRTPSPCDLSRTSRDLRRISRTLHRISRSVPLAPFERDADHRGGEQSVSSPLHDLRVGWAGEHRLGGDTWTGTASPPPPHPPHLRLCPAISFGSSAQVSRAFRHTYAAAAITPHCQQCHNRFTTAV